ncbi:acyltransferase [Streptomyces sp. WZ-12]|uniref:acyltransferase n=1 Tax=Streptomyces sp. WZ-12 TaxID=3030210 RepID=UPI002380C6EA|nr:transferase hexapeptide repeat family protein [Streptomyces sp. WZ-12]
MARIYEIDGVAPRVHPLAYVHPDAVLIGDVTIGPDAYIAPLASLRGDFGAIRIGAGANVQDGCVLHCFPDTTTIVEEDGHIGHGTVLHGCRIGAGALIGMNSVIMDGAVVGERSFVAANSFVKSGFEVPARHLALGSPARTARELTDDEMAWKANGTRLYQELGRRSVKTLRPVPDDAHHAWPALTGDGGQRVQTPPDGRTAAAHVPLNQYRAAANAAREEER